MLSLPKGDDTGSEQNSGLVSKIKSVATLITAVSALLAALGSYMKEPDTTASSKSYDVLISEIRTLSEENQRQHDMIMGLRGALDHIVHTQRYSYSAPRTTIRPTPLSPEQSFDNHLTFESQEIEPIHRTPTVPKAKPRPKKFEPKSFQDIMK